METSTLWISFIEITAFQTLNNFER